MDLLKIGIVLILYGVLFFAFGSLITCHFTKDKFSVGLTILLGFFLYYLLFQIVAVPMMFAQRSLTELRIVWCVAAVLVAVISVFTSRQIWLDAWKNHKKAEESSLKGKDKFWNLFWRAVPFLATSCSTATHTSPPGSR